MFQITIIANAILSILNKLGFHFLITRARIIARSIFIPNPRNMFFSKNFWSKIFPSSHLPEVIPR